MELPQNLVIRSSQINSQLNKHQKSFDKMDNVPANQPRVITSEFGDSTHIEGIVITLGGMSMLLRQADLQLLHSTGQYKPFQPTAKHLIYIHQSILSTPQTAPTTTLLNQPMVSIPTNSKEEPLEPQTKKMKLKEPQPKKKRASKKKPKTPVNPNVIENTDEQALKDFEAYLTTLNMPTQQGNVV
jgi:hypothetical protein